MPGTDRRRTRRTVLELQRLASGDWLATQAGEEIEARGPTAAAAAAAYCRRIHERETGAGGRAVTGGAPRTDRGS